MTEPPRGALNRPITTTEFMLIQKMFALNRGYKDLIRDFKKEFNLDIPKKLAKEWMTKRSWHDVFLYLTGDEIDTSDRDKIPEIEYKHYELLEKMIKVNKQDERERQEELKEFESGTYYIDENVKYFNFPLFGEIITYRFKEPFLKCFLPDPKTGKIVRIEDVPISSDLPEFLLRIVRKINSCCIKTEKTLREQLDDSLLFPHYASDEYLSKATNVFDSKLFQKYNFTFKA